MINDLIKDQKPDVELMKRQAGWLKYLRLSLDRIVFPGGVHTSWYADRKDQLVELLGILIADFEKK
jgi:hypothetical protein